MGRNRSALSVRYCWLLVILLTPLLAGGVLVGDEALLLQMARGFDNSALSFAEYARSPAGWYIPHHILWFSFIYVTAHVAAFLHASPLVTEAVISCETVAAGLAGIMLCYVFLIRRQGLAPASAAWIVLAFFAGGYGAFTFCMGGTVESYMVLAMSLRLFFSEKRAGAHAWHLAIVDAVLVTFKAYSLIFLIITWPLLRMTRHQRIAYFLPFGILFLILVALKLWLWNDVYNSAIAGVSFFDSPYRFAQQFISPWTGLLFCLPVMLVLFWHRKLQRRALLFKIAGLCGCAAFFSTYSFFNGDIPGGRYIFPFVVALLPEIGAAASHLLDRAPRAAWLLPAAVVAFLPVAALGLPFFSNAMPSVGRCHPDHPVVFSWKVLLAKLDGSRQVEICFRQEEYVLSARDVASPRLGPWRVAYLLNGGHSARYRAIAHDQNQKQHDAWGDRLAGLLRSMGLGSPYFWEAIGLVPAILALWLSLLAAIRINRPARRSAPAD